MELRAAPAQPKPKAEPEKEEKPEASAKETGKVSIRGATSETGKVSIRGTTSETGPGKAEVTGQSILSPGRVSATPDETKRVVVIVVEESNSGEILEKLLEATNKEFYIITDSARIGEELRTKAP